MLYSTGHDISIHLNIPIHKPALRQSTGLNHLASVSDLSVPRLHPVMNRFFLYTFASSFFAAHGAYEIPS